MKRKLSIERFEERLTMDISAAAAQLVYELNLARHDPRGYALERGLSVDLSSVAKRPPLAINDALTVSATDHANEMASEDYLAHQSPFDGRQPNLMARDAGYVLPGDWPDAGNFIESIAGGEDLIFSTGVLDQWLAASEQTEIANRNMLLGVGSPFADYTEVGACYASNFNSSLRNYWSLQAAYSSVSDVFLAGFVYDDKNGDGRYQAGEGMAGVNIEVGSFSTITGEAGNWSIQVAGGSHSVRASGGGLTEDKVTSVQVGTDNVQVDFLKSGTTQINFSSSSSWTNPIRNVDVDGNGTVFPLDVLLILNKINAEGSQTLPAPGVEPPPYYDTSGDGKLTPLDALLVINHLNRFGAG